MALPDEAQFGALNTEIGALYQPRQAQMREDQAYFEGAYRGNLELPADVQPKAIIGPLARNIVQTAQSHIRVDQPLVTVPARRGRKKQERYDDQAQKLQQAYETFLRLSGQRTARTKPLVKLRNYLFLRGMAVSKTMPTVHAGQLDDATDVFGLGMFPVGIWAPDPVGIMEDPDNDKPRWVIEVTQMRGHEIWEQFGEDESCEVDVEGLEGDLTYQTVYEYWHYKDGMRRFLGMNGGVLQTWEHDWGMHPYDFAFSGFGVEDETLLGPSSSTREPSETLAVGILTHLRKGRILDATAETVTRASYYIKRSIWANMLVDASLPPQALVPGSASVVRITRQPDQRLDDFFTTLKPEPLDPQWMQAVQMFTADAYDTTAPNAVRGIRDPGVRSASHQQELSMTQTLRYGDGRDNLQVLLQEVNAKFGFFHERVLKKPITIYSLAEHGHQEVVLQPKDWDGYYLNFVELKLTDPAERDRNLVAAKAVVDLGGSRKLALRDIAGIENAQEHLEEAAAENLVNSEPLMQALVQEVMQRFAMRMAESQEEVEPAAGTDPMANPAEAGSREFLESLQAIDGVGPGVAPGTSVVPEMQALRRFGGAGPGAGGDLGSTAAGIPV